jgi:hypothetical protein
MFVAGSPDNRAIAMKMTVFVLLGLLVFAFLCVWLLTHIRYHLTSRYLKITLLGVCLRRIRLEDIESVSKRRPTGWAENWSSTFRPNHRMLVIRRHRGLRKHIIITPKNRYIFKTDLERLLKIKPPASESAPETVSAAPDYPGETAS